MTDSGSKRSRLRKSLDPPEKPLLGTCRAHLAFGAGTCDLASKERYLPLTRGYIRSEVQHSGLAKSDFATISSLPSPTTKVSEMPRTRKNGQQSSAPAWEAQGHGSADDGRHEMRSISTDSTDTRLRRLFGFGQILGFALNFMNSWEVMVISFGATVYNGGSASLAWGTALVVMGSLTQAMTMAELASILPIAGAQYHWTELLAPEKHKRFITWVQGWVTWFAW